jgi:hypothetical protein
MARLKPAWVCAAVQLDSDGDDESTPSCLLPQLGSINREGPDFAMSTPGPPA